MADIESGIVENKNLHILVACATWLAGRLTWPTACGTFFLCCCVGYQGSFHNGLCGANPPPADVGGRVQFGV